MSAYSDIVVADGPAAYWRLGDTSGSTAVRLVGSWNGTYANCTLNQDGLIGSDPSAKSVLFNGSSSYLSTPGQCGVSGIPLTVEFWVKPSQAAMIGVFDSAPGMTSVIRNYAGDAFEWWNNNPTVSYNFLSGSTYHVVVVFKRPSSRTVLLYVNGSLVATGTGTTEAQVTITAWRFGDINSGSAGRYSGYMQDLALYAKELTSDRVAAHWAASQVTTIRASHALPFSGLGALVKRDRLPLWADGDRNVHSSPYAPPLEMLAGRQGAATIPIESQIAALVQTVVMQLETSGLLQGFTRPPVDSMALLQQAKTVVAEALGGLAASSQIQWSVELGWLQARQKLPLAATGWDLRVHLVPLDARGSAGILIHLWSVLQPSTGVVSHTWQVTALLETGEIAHSWTVQTEQGGQAQHLWRVLRNEIVLARSRDIQLPYATQVITPGE